MNRALKVLCASGIAFVAAAFALFRGYFDHGLFEVKQTDWSSSGKVAIVAERSDHQALAAMCISCLWGTMYSFPPSCELPTTEITVSLPLPVTA